MMLPPQRDSHQQGQRPSGASKKFVDKQTFKQIFHDHWGAFKDAYPTYNTAYYDEIIQKMLNCGDPKEMGYIQYRCFNCGEFRRIGFTCKSSFCLSCAKGYTDKWVDFIAKRFFPHVPYRHIILTVPDRLRHWFQEDPTLLDHLMQTGHQCLLDVFDYLKDCPIDIGTIVVLHTYGRAGNYNPHLHIVTTAGGLDDCDQWLKVNYIPFELVNKKWKYYLLKMLREHVEDPYIRYDIDYYWNFYKNGFVTHVKKGEVPKGGKGLAKYLARYLVSPPISIRRITAYDGNSVSYWYRDHRTKDITHVTVPVLEFIHRMVMHILPKNFQRIRYFGLHSSKRYQKIRDHLATLLRFDNSDAPDAYRVMPRKDFAQLFFQWFGKSPLTCPSCGETMVLECIYHPQYGKIRDYFEDYLGNDDETQKSHLSATREGLEAIQRPQQLSFLPVPEV